MFRVLFLFVVAMMMSTASAQDLSDNEVCMECHIESDPPGPVMGKESHQDWSCIDCHDYIVEIPHSDDVVGADVDCLNCHDEVPDVK